MTRAHDPERRRLEAARAELLAMIMVIAAALIIDSPTFTFIVMVATCGVFVFMLLGVTHDIGVLDRQTQWRRFRNVPEPEVDSGKRSQPPRRKME